MRTAGATDGPPNFQLSDDHSTDSEPQMLRHNIKDEASVSSYSSDILHHMFIPPVHPLHALLLSEEMLLAVVYTITAGQQ